MIKFGTDGWRAVISEEFTFDNVKIVAQAMADFINKDRQAKDKQIIVGYDTRFLSERYAQTVACVLAANGIGVILTDRAVPTPAVSFAILNKKLGGGIMITASHNPAEFNGIKYKAHYGGSAGPEITKVMEQKLYKNRIRFLPLEEAKKVLVKIENIMPDYLKAISDYVDIEALKDRECRVLVDIMHGAGDSYVAEFLSGGKCKVDNIRSEINPGFGGKRPEPSPENLKETAEIVKKGNYDIGLATDGDVDRLGVITPEGEVISGHKVMALLLLHLVEDKKLSGSVAQTICGTFLINKICQKYNLEMHETPVGFKYICEIMRNETVLIGGEETGGIGFKDFIPERDGILSGLLILELMAYRKKGILEILKDVEREYGSFVYQRLDSIIHDGRKKKMVISRLKGNPPKDILGKSIKEIKTIDGIKFICEDMSWLMIRPSGTEPLVRIYAEAPDIETTRKMLQFGKEMTFK